MHRYILFLLFSFTISVHAQHVINGIVLSEKNTPLEDATVYLNNTTIGTTTGQNGKFQLTIPNKNHELIISFLGYKTAQYKVSELKLTTPLTIRLIPGTNILDEVIVQKTKYDDDWYYNLSRFKRAFLGRSKLALTCSILNPKVLHFEYNFKTKTLIASAREPLKIKHKGLGYLITYDLVDFSLGNEKMFFSGYAQYKNLKKPVKKKWAKNRLTAFNGSRMHFLRGLITENLKKDGFVVNQFKRVPNPDLPSTKDIKKAREVIKLYKKPINFNTKFTEPKTALDSALVILKESRKPKYRDYLYKKNVSYKDIITLENGKPILNFKDHLSIIYTKEPEERNYLIGMFGKQKKASGVQTSNIVLLIDKVEIGKSGILASPHAIFNEGYWAFESFADMLPLDYQPPEE
ncbi:carboxypeptidase-like regulatory domain-containing protein [Aureibaculum conchae]|uniref:carboxypeptidase-like regulatory domain-containing protein n=1 Tax=Aureibaculum sp. 2308TA14-22 TaxID=3108392 RepID=UPI003392BEF7